MLYKRPIFDKIYDFLLKNKEIIVLIGSRQVGKTTIMRQIKQRLLEEKQTEEKNIFTFDLEGYADQLVWNEPLQIEEKLKTIGATPNTKYIFVDEFTRVPNSTSTIKYIHDHYPHVKFIISGSSSISILKNIKESMAGRKQIFEIYPFNFAEFLSINNPKAKEEMETFSQNPLLTEPAVSILNLAMKEFLQFGGYPAVVMSRDTETKQNKISELVNSYLIKDIQTLARDKTMESFSKLLTALAAQNSSLLNVSNLAKTLNLPHATIIRQLNILSNTYFLHLLPPFFKNKQKELVKMNKAFLSDTGLANYLLNRPSLSPGSSEYGSTVEVFVALEFFKTIGSWDKIHYWRDKAGHEVDFVLKTQNQIIPIEVKSGPCDKIPTGLKNFIDLYKPTQAFVLNEKFVGEIKSGDCHIYFRPLWFASQITQNQPK